MAKGDCLQRRRLSWGGGGGGLWAIYSAMDGPGGPILGGPLII